MEFLLISLLFLAKPAIQPYLHASLSDFFFLQGVFEFAGPQVRMFHRVTQTTVLSPCCFSESHRNSVVSSSWRITVRHRKLKTDGNAQSAERLQIHIFHINKSFTADNVWQIILRFMSQFHSQQVLSHHFWTELKLSWRCSACNLKGQLLPPI